MTISYQWLLDYLPLGQAGMPVGQGLLATLPVAELSNILTSIGLEVEAVERAEAVPGGLEGLIIGEVLTCAKHPNADKLSITTVNTGGAEPLKIVCGAPNVAAGQRVIIAPVGTTVHPTNGDPFPIKKAKIRGEDSEGMICAEDEIGLGDSHAGILILPADAPIGTLARDYFKIPETDYAIHIGLTPNRSDANSHIGVARDICAYLTHHKGDRYSVVLPPEFKATLREDTLIKVNIDDAEACPRFTGISLKNVKIAESPEWLKQRLQTIGVRSINNVVDITNFVLHEYGQPLHAYDADKLRGAEINVRFMPEGTSFVALDEKERKLRSEDIIICDATGPIGLGGVFGGQYTGITNGTTHVFLESAYFNPAHIRRTSMHHGLRTDAALHFEKGVDINNVLPALLRAAALMVDIAGAEVSSAVTDIYPTHLQHRTVTLAYSYIQKLSGKAYNPEAITKLLTAMGFGIIEATDTHLTLQVPSDKTDVSQPADIVEEILRIDGLDNVLLTGRLDIALTKPMPGDRALKERMAELLCGMGFQEIVTNSIVNSKYYPGNDNLVRMINSLSSELDVMRPSMLESGLEVIQYNCNRKNQDLSLFEFGHVYCTAAGKYIQEPRLALWLSGLVRRKQWNQPDEKTDLFYVKGIINNMLDYSGITGTQLTYPDNGNEAITSWKWKNQLLCTISKVAAPILKELDVKQDVYFADIHWDVWVKAMAAHKIRYTEVPKFPAVTRDLALVLDTAVTYRQVQETTEALKIPSLRSFGLFDVFESEKLGVGKKSYALSYTFQLQDRTLTDTEIEQLMKQLINAYTTVLNAQIR